MLQLMLQPGRAPGRATPGEQPAAPAPKSETTQSADGPPASPPGGGGLFNGMGMMLLLPLLLFGLILLMNRSDKKRRKDIEAKLKKGDRVVTRAGFIGKIVEVGEANARVEIAPGVVVKMVKTAIEGLAEEDSAKKEPAATKDTDAKADKDGKKKK